MIKHNNRKETLESRIARLEKLLNVKSKGRKFEEFADSGLDLLLDAVSSCNNAIDCASVEDEAVVEALDNVSNSCYLITKNLAQQNIHVKDKDYYQDMSRYALLDVFTDIQADLEEVLEYFDNDSSVVRKYMNVRLVKQFADSVDDVISALNDLID